MDDAGVSADDGRCRGAANRAPRRRPLKELFRVRSASATWPAIGSNGSAVPWSTTMGVAANVWAASQQRSIIEDRRHRRPGSLQSVRRARVATNRRSRSRGKSSSNVDGKRASNSFTTCENRRSSTVVRHQHPAAMELLAVQREFQVALFKTLFGIVAVPGAAIPELHGAAAVLALRDVAFEIAVIERVILDLDRQPLVVGVERGPPVTAQDLKTPPNSSLKS